VTGETRVDEPGSGVGQQAEAAERAFAFESRSDVIRKRYLLIRRAERELARVQDERLFTIHLDQVGEVWLILGWVDERILVVVEQPEEAVEAHVDARWLDHFGVVRIQSDPPVAQLGLDVAIGEQHGIRLSERLYPECMQTTRGLDRLVFFTDAVSAIAITLLILPLVDSVGQAADKGLDPGQFIGDNLAQIAAFVLSFAVIARMWMTHHAIFEHVKTYNRSLLLLSLAWAFTIVVLPLPTEMVSRFETDPVTIVFYIGTMAVSSLTLMGMILLIRRHPQLELDDNPVGGRAVFPTVSTTIGFFVALIIAVLVPAVNFYALFIILLTMPLQRIYNRRADAAARATT